MRCISTNELTPGMLLSQKVVSNGGVKLLDKHTCLTEPQIHKLYNWGVDSLYIQDGVDIKVAFMEKYEEIV